MKKKKMGEEKKDPFFKLGTKISSLLPIHQPCSGFPAPARPASSCCCCPAPPHPTLAHVLPSVAQAGQKHHSAGVPYLSHLGAPCRSEEGGKNPHLDQEADPVPCPLPPAALPSCYSGLLAPPKRNVPSHLRAFAHAVLSARSSPPWHLPSPRPLPPMPVHSPDGHPGATSFGNVS